MILVVSKRNLKRAGAALESLGERYYEIGSIVESARARVVYR
jgi:phosphoribosylaminoimidazole (AIR) synthetase